MMTYIETQNSTYEIDYVNKRARGGRIGPFWRNFFRIDRISGCLLFSWDDKGDKILFTSHVVSESNVSPTNQKKKAVSW